MLSTSSNSWYHACSGLRSTARTTWPARRSAATRWPPIKPPAPVTSNVPAPRAAFARVCRLPFIRPLLETLQFSNADSGDGHRHPQADCRRNAGRTAGRKRGAGRLFGEARGGQRDAPTRKPASGVAHRRLRSIRNDPAASRQRQNVIQTRKLSAQPRGPRSRKYSDDGKCRSGSEGPSRSPLMSGSGLYSGNT